jgi:hypothetical protein
MSNYETNGITMDENTGLAMGLLSHHARLAERGSQASQRAIAIAAITAGAVCRADEAAAGEQSRPATPSEIEALLGVAQELVYEASRLGKLAYEEAKADPDTSEEGLTDAVDGRLLTMTLAQTFRIIREMHDRQDGERIMAVTDFFVDMEQERLAMLARHN